MCYQCIYLQHQLLLLYIYFVHVTEVITSSLINMFEMTGKNEAEHMIYLLTAIGLSPSGKNTVHIYTQTIHRTIQNKQYIEQHNNFGRVWAVPRLGSLYPGICLTTVEKAKKKPQSESKSKFSLNAWFLTFITLYFIQNTQVTKTK